MELNPSVSSAFSNRLNLFTATAAPGQGSSSHDDADDDGTGAEEGKHQLRDLI